MRRDQRLNTSTRVALLIATLGVAALATPAIAAAPRAGSQPHAGAVTATPRTDTRALLDSARLWRLRGRDDLSAAALRKLLAIAPQDRVALRLLVAIEIEAGHMREAEALLARLERAHPQAAEAGELRALLVTARAQGRRAVRDRLHALDVLPEEPLRVTRDSHVRKTPAARSTVSAAPTSTAAAELEPAVAPPPAPATPDPAAIARQQRAQADALLAQRNASAALAELQEAVRLDPRSAWVRFDLARLQQRQGEPAEARDTISAGLAAAPDDVEMAYAAALYYAGIDADADARATLARIERSRWSEGMQQLDRRLLIAWLLATARTRAGSGDAAAARAALQQATTLAAADASVLVRAGWTAQSYGDYARSRGYFDAATAAARASADADEEGAARRGIDYLESLRQSFVSGGFELNGKPGEPGISRFERRIVPLELRWALDYDRQLFVHLDHLDLSAGRLDLTNFAAATDYGQVLAAGPPAPGGSQRPGASGLMAGIGFQFHNWRFDAGHLPGAFPASYAVGGLRYEGRLRGFDCSVDLARRPVTSTLISFAGVRDPASGAIWGGVHRTGLGLGASRERSGHDAYARLGLYALAGRNVASNTEADLLAGYDWYQATRESLRLTLGTTLTIWRFARNQRFQTFGHGGYYSPQSYLALGLPAQWSGDRGAWSWRLRAAVAWSTTRENDAPFHPTDATLQAAAAAQATANGLGTAVHAGGSGGGFSIAASGGLEYRLTDAWTVGARFQLDRSEDYSPDTFGVWFRYRLNTHGTLWGAPRAPRVYAYY